MPAKTQYFVMVEDRHVPIVAFFGTKGGVGKTTIVDKFSTLVSRAEAKPNVLIVDFDVYHRGITILRAGNQAGLCKTIHEYAADEGTPFDQAQDVTPAGSFYPHGRELMIPSSDSGQTVYGSIAKTEPAKLMLRLREILTAAAKEYDISLILVDCGPIVDPLTATAAYMSDFAFIIGQNEPITFQNYQDYSTQIREFYPDFDASKVKLIINKMRGQLQQRVAVYATIPFTMEVVDYAEGLTNIDEIRLALLDYSVHGLVSAIFSGRFPGLTPRAEVVFPPPLREAIDNIPRFGATKWHRRLRAKAILSGLIVALAAVAAVLARVLTTAPEPYDPSAQHFWHQLFPGIMLIVALAALLPMSLWTSQLRQANRIIKLHDHATYEQILAFNRDKKGRLLLDRIRLLSDKTIKEVQA